MHQFPGGIHYMSATAVGSQEKNLRRGRNLQIRGIPAARMLILAIVASLQLLLSHPAQVDGESIPARRRPAPSRSRDIFSADSAEAEAPSHCRIRSSARRYNT